VTQVVAYDTAARNTMRRLTENPTTLDLSFGKIGVRGAVAAAERCASPLSVSYGHVGCFEGKGLSTLRSSNSSRTQYALGRRRHLSLVAPFLSQVLSVVGAPRRLLTHASVASLSLAYNPVGDRGFRAIAHALRHGGGVTSLVPYPDLGLSLGGA
jgi:hypothetical protein